MSDPLQADAERLGVGGTTFEALLPTLLGIREVVASLMWVQADDYFHRGEYAPVLSMIKQIVAIDPHQVDVYATGAWHMAYNFMDKRLIEDGVRFLQDGCRNNDTLYDLYFELGYMHYDKTKDFPQAVAAYRKGSERGMTTGATIPPSYVRHQLAHAIEKMGDIDQAVQQWDANFKVGTELAADPGRRDGPAGPNVAASLHNRYITLRRRNERMAAVAERERNAVEAAKLWQLNVDLADEWLRRQPNHSAVVKDRRTAVAQVARLRAGNVLPLAQNEANLRFKLTRTASRKLKIEGTCNLLNLSKIRVQFEDENYLDRAKQGLPYKMQNCTLEWDNATVKDHKFSWVIDLDRDPADMERSPTDIYPLKADHYIFTLQFNPRLQAAFIQDLYGWSGEGITAPANQLVTDPTRSAVMMGKQVPLRLLQRSIRLTRDDVVGKGKKVLFEGS